MLWFLWHDRNRIHAGYDIQLYSLSPWIITYPLCLFSYLVFDYPCITKALPYLLSPWSFNKHSLFNKVALNSTRGGIRTHMHFCLWCNNQVAIPYSQRVPRSIFCWIGNFLFNQQKTACLHIRQAVCFLCFYICFDSLLNLC